MRARRVSVFTLFLIVMWAVPAFGAPAYRITKTVPLGGPDRWDYVTFDQSSGRVYVAHGDRLSVVDGTSGAILGSVVGMPGGAHGTAIVTSLGRGYTDDGRAGVVVAFDLKSLKPIATIKAQPDADGIVFDRVSGRLFVIDGDSAKITVIDPKTNEVVATIEGGGGLEAGTADDAGNLYVDGAQNNELLRIDAKTNRIVARWPLPGCKTPRGVAVDAAHRRVFASCANAVLDVLDADTGAALASAPIGGFTDGAAYDPVRKRAFSSNGAGTLSVIDEKTPNSFVSEPDIATMIGARTMAVDAKSGRVFLMAGEYTINEKADAADIRHRYVVTPGSAKLLFLDPQ